MTKKSEGEWKGSVCVTEDMNMMRHHCLELGSAAHSRQNMYLSFFFPDRPKNK